VHSKTSAIDEDFLRPIGRSFAAGYPRTIRQAEVGAAKTMIERTEERFGLKPERLAGDTAYGAAPTACDPARN
jgi:hypothetical protein